MIFWGKWNHCTVYETSWAAPLLNAHLQWNTRHCIPCLSCMPKEWLPIVEKIPTDSYETVMSCLQQSYAYHYALHTQKCKCSPTPSSKLTIISSLLMPCLDTNCMILFNNVHLHLSFLSNCSKCPMLPTNLQFSKIRQCTYMMVTNWSSFWCIVLVYAFHRCCLCVATKTLPVLMVFHDFCIFLWFLFTPRAQHVEEVCKPNMQKVNI